MQSAKQFLNKDSPFELLAQYAIDTYYSPPYPFCQDKRPNDVNRFYHGGPHVSSTALNLELCLELYQHYSPELLQIPNGAKLSAESIKLLRLAAIYHDSANTAESCKLTKEHADNFRRDMLKFGFDEDRVEEIARAMENKEGNIDKSKSSVAEIKDGVAKKNIYQKLIQSADCLDNLRTRGNAFEKKYLDILYDLGDCNGFSEEMNEIIKGHFERMKYFQKVNGKTTETHLKCAYASNCYLAVRDFYYTLATSKNSHAQSERSNTLSLREIYRLKSKSNSLPKKVYVRVLLNSTIAEELKICNENLIALKHAKIQTTTELKDFLTEQEKTRGKVFAPKGLKWRPATLIPDAQLPISLYASEKDINGILLIIDASDPDTFGCCYYKKNIFSNLAKNGNINYTRSILTRAKDLESPEELENKIFEINARRQGLIEDTYLQYFGQRLIDCNETLLVSYKKIVGIGILRNDSKCIDAAVKACEAMADPTVGCYIYLPGTGFRLLTNEEMYKKQINEPNTRMLAQAAVELEKQLNIDKVTHITISSALTRFKFFIAGLEYLGYMKNGMPTIESNGIVINDQTRFLKALYKKYFEQQLQLLNQIICKEIKLLKIYGVTKFDFSLHSKKPTEKLYVNVVLQYDSNKNIDEIMCFLYAILGKYANKLVVKERSEASVFVQFPVTDILLFNQHVLAALRSLAENAENNISTSFKIDAVKAQQKAKMITRIFPQPIETIPSLPAISSTAIASQKFASYQHSSTADNSYILPIKQFPNGKAQLEGPAEPLSPAHTHMPLQSLSQQDKLRLEPQGDSPETGENRSHERDKAEVISSTLSKKKRPTTSFSLPPFLSKDKKEDKTERLVFEINEPNKMEQRPNREMSRRT